jgi:hypothetical protein
MKQKKYRVSYTALLKNKPLLSKVKGLIFLSKKIKYYSAQLII